MREIKFRGKRVDTGEWVFGDLMQARTRDGVSCYICECYLNGVTIKVIPESVGQFCGLHDKNGVEIYTGDIMEWGGIRLLVDWDPIHARINIGKDLLTKGYAITAEVIGSIHTNPELLK